MRMGGEDAWVSARVGVGGLTRLTHRSVGGCSGTCSYCCWLLATREWPWGPAEALTG